MNSILITGGTGFAGSHLVELLLNNTPKDQIHVTAFSSKPSFVTNLLPTENIHAVDLTNTVATHELITSLQPSQIYHLAAISEVGSSFEKTTEIFANNFNLQFNVLEAVRQFSPNSKLLIIGSAQEYDVLAHQSSDGKVLLREDAPLGPANPYGVSKVAQDLLALSYFYAHKLNIIRVRPFNHFGERQTQGFAMADFARQIVQVERGELSEIKVGNLSAVRDFTDVKDIVAGYQLLMDKGQLGGVYNLGSGQGRSVQSMLDELITFAQAPVKVTVDQSKIRPLDVQEIIADTTKVKQLGWQPTINLSQTLQRTLEYWRKQT